ncbi:restriction endonuclease subunit S [Escherichia marmotae]|uniref:Restriction endonuclease subunit S n=1 Tax=Escherichia marmotae TaxID=1499973 RepID=A0A7L5X184_9ESCH|nr:restriction endonuclease subunit S [Escherichia marmotae]MED8812706.1 restriction endonuclease subunit S [Escherichia marmotae]QLP25679.1 restriction endonuclease subunit S [Escherichia marmotae]
MSAGKLPEGWEQIEIGDIADVISGGTPKSGVAENFAPSGEGIAWLTPADLSGYKEKYISHGARDLTTLGYSSCSAKLMPKGTILFSSRAPIGYVAIAANEIATNQGFKSFAFPSDIFPDYAYYFLRNIRHIAEEMGTGTTFKEISGSSAKTLPFVLAPLAEQKIIAEKLDTLLAQVDSAKARLEQIPQILKRFRQAVYQYACSGRILDKVNPKITQLETLVSIHNGARKPVSSVVREGIKGIYPYYGATGIVDYLNDFTHEGRFLLVGEDGANLLSKSKKLAYIINGKSWVNNHAHVLKEKDNNLLDFIQLAINSLDISQWVSGSAQPKLTKKSLLTLPIPVFTLEEQTIIVRRVEQLFAYADTIEKQVNNALARVNNLTQSILAKAFRGELTAQWRAENPELISGENSAAALLEKIKAERAASGGKKASRKKS